MGVLGGGQWVDSVARETDLDPRNRFAYSRPAMSATRWLFSIVMAVGGVFSADAAEPLQVAPQDGVLLLRNQNVLKGKISRVADHYLVAVSGGEIRVRAREVELFCRDLDEGYRRKRATLEQGRIEDHLGLAAWCLRQGLFGYAAKELIDARAADPTHPKIALFERRLHLAARARPLEKIGRPSPKATRPLPSADDLQRVVERLPPGTVEIFTDTIQPLLLNSCSTAACHGPRSSNHLRFGRSGGRTMSRRFTQRNLHAVLQQIDQDQPDQSRLLIKASTPHASVKAEQTPPLDRRQTRKLADWVRLATAYKPPKVTTVHEPSAELLQTISGFAASSVLRPRGTPLSRRSAQDQANGQNAESNVKGDKTRGSRIQQAQPRSGASGTAAKDPFDPSIFNSQHASPSR